MTFIWKRAKIEAQFADDHSRGIHSNAVDGCQIKTSELIQSLTHRLLAFFGNIPGFGF